MSDTVTADVLDELRSYDPDVSDGYVIDRAIAEIVRLRAELATLAEFDRNRAAS